MESFRHIRLGAFVALVSAFLLVAVIPARAADAVVYAQDATTWHTTNVAIPAGGSIKFQNQDTKYDHTVQCDQGSSNAACPWADAPRLAKRASAVSPPETVTISFPYDGTFGFICSIHPNMTGTIKVGVGHPPPTQSPKPAPVQSQSAAPSVRASTAPSKTASPSASASAKIAPRTTVKARTTSRPAASLRGRALAPVSSTGKGPGAGATIPAALLIAIVAGAHLVRMRRSA